MSNDSKDNVGEAIKTLFIQKWHSPITKPALGIICTAALAILAHWISKYNETNFLHYVEAFSCWMLGLGASGLLSMYLVGYLTNETNKKEWETLLSELTKARDEADAASKKLADQRVAFEVERAQKQKSLEHQEQQFNELLKSKHDWLYNDEQILKLESETDKEIIVLAPDFYYEQQPDYERIIIENLARDPGPTYAYFVIKSSRNEGQHNELRRRLEDGVKAKGHADAIERVHSKFMVHFIPDELFPHATVYGLAIYRFCNSKRKARCLVYWPKEIGSWNLDILAAGKEGESIVAAIDLQLKKFAKAYPYVSNASK